NHFSYYFRIIIVKFKPKKMNHLLSVLLMASPQGSDANPLVSFLPLLLIILVFYFFMIRPQMKKQKDLRNYRENLKKGDKIITTGGIYGRIADIKENQIIMEVEDKIRIRIDKSAVLKDPSDIEQRK
ncbi:MAG TPA: preprotein translocase subunit YajC, partial [Bacteroidales bacterium]|nr:preprotein translocase subunit YajC [Bacteroidales bacterium]